MKKEVLILVVSIAIVLNLIGCSNKIIHLTNNSLHVVNREITSLNSSNNTLTLNRKAGDGIAVIKDVEFSNGIIELELKGENNPGKSFVGIAFNIQNDSTYEAIYFRPFNFRSDEKIRREHSIQYIYHPKYNWRHLRTNFKGQYEADFPRQPSPNDWFEIQIKIDSQNVYVYDKKTKTELFSTRRITHQISDKIGLWTGFNSNGAFRNLKIMK
jgi:hypothetical protein